MKSTGREAVSPAVSAMLALHCGASGIRVWRLVGGGRKDESLKYHSFQTKTVGTFQVPGRRTEETTRKGNELSITSELSTT